MRPRPRTTPDEWAKANRVYDATTGIPGPRDPGITPYVIAPSRAVHARTHKRVVFVVSAQSGKTESIFDVLGERLDSSPVPMIYVGPTEKFVREQLSPRIDDLIEGTPLRHKAARGQKMKVTRKVVGGVPLRLAHGGSSSALKSDPFGLAVTDEADELMANVKGAGDPISLIDRRGDTYADFVHYVTSTPSEGPVDTEIDEVSGLEFWAKVDLTEVSSTIWRLWQSGTMYHWAWPCPNCDKFFIPRSKLLHWKRPVGPDEKPRNPDPGLARATAHVSCPHCGTDIVDDAEGKTKAAMNARGVYVAPGQTISKAGKVLGHPPDTWTISYWVSGLCSPFVSWGERAAQMVEALNGGGPAEVQAVVNGSFGELYAAGAGTGIPEWRTLHVLKREDEPFRLGEVPKWAKFLTLASDVQKDRLIYSIRAWGARSTSALVGLGELWGDTAYEDVWDELGKVIEMGVGGFPIRRAAVDSGFRPGNPKEVPENRVYSFCQRFGNVAPTKGRATLAGQPVRPSKIEARVNWRGKVETVGLELLHVDTDYFKRMVHERLTRPPDQLGAFLLPEDVPDYYLQQLVSEARVKRPGGRPEWVKRSKENHFFDVEAMQAALGWLCGAQRILPAASMREAPSEPPVAAQGPSPVSQPRTRKPDARASKWSAALNR
ncbi:phage terminase GpA [Stappia sp. 22II-S9-Z10]|nr:phage terminase GpA [Stappia sp. 22II-S9-Z10]